MLTKSVNAAIALTLLIATTAAQQVNICQGVANNIFLTDVTNCTNYFWCNNGQAVPQQCQPVNNQTTYFNGAAQACVYSNTQCLSCPSNQLTFQPLAHSCNSYIMCFAGTPVVQQCADNLQWDNNMQVCNFPNIVDCVSSQCSVYSDASNIVYIPSASNCSTYYICVRGVAQNQTCAANTLFNPAINKCDPNYNCTIGASAVARRRSVAVPVTPKFVDINCPPQGVYYYPHAQNNKYYMCVNGAGALLSCANGLFYDVKANNCREIKNMLKQ